MSKSGELNRADWRAAGKAALIWLIPVASLYVNSVIAVIQMEGHVFSWNDLVPSAFVTGSIVTWFFMQVQGLLLRLQRGGK